MAPYTRLALDLRHAFWSRVFGAALSIALRPKMVSLGRPSTLAKHLNASVSLGTPNTRRCQGLYLAAPSVAHACCNRHFVMRGRSHPDGCEMTAKPPVFQMMRQPQHRLRRRSQTPSEMAGEVRFLLQPVDLDCGHFERVLRIEGVVVLTAKPFHSKAKQDQGSQEIAGPIPFIARSNGMHNDAVASVQGLPRSWTGNLITGRELNAAWQRSHRQAHAEVAARRHTKHRLHRSPFTF